MNSKVDKDRKRIRYFDLLRLVCFFMIIYFHMLKELQALEIYSAEAIHHFYKNPNANIAKLAVAVFFMLSGAGLALGTQTSLDFKQDKGNNINKIRNGLGKFYLRRFSRLLIPFYVVNVLWYGIYWIIHHKLFFPEIPVWKYIFTILGIDEWISMHGIQTYSSSVGEWFLGALIILYLLFPLFKYLSDKYPKAFISVAFIVYLLVAFTFSSWNIAFPFTWNKPSSHMNILLKGFEFIVGMYIGRNVEKINPKCAFVTVPVCILFFVCQIPFGINDAILTTVLAVAFFVSFSSLESVLQSKNFKIVEWISGISYEIYLVHHLVIYNFTPHVAGFFTGKAIIVLFYLVELVIMLVAAIIVKLLSDLLIRRVIDGQRN